MDKKRLQYAQAAYALTEMLREKGITVPPTNLDELTDIQLITHVRELQYKWRTR